MELRGPNQRRVDAGEVFQPAFLFHGEILEDWQPQQDFQIVNGVRVQMVAEDVADPPRSIKPACKCCWKTKGSLLPVAHSAQVEEVHPEVVSPVEVIMGCDRGASQ